MSIKKPSEKLRQKLNDVVKHFQNCATLVDEVFTLGLEEGFSEKEIGQMIRKQLLRLGYNPRSIRRVLPSSVKDVSKTRKDYLARDQVNNSDIQLDDDITSSSQNRYKCSENKRAIEALEVRISTLEGQLTQEQMKNEDLEIQIKNALDIIGQLRGQLQTAQDVASRLLISREKFPPNFGQVFESQNHVFVVEFRGTEVLDIGVITQQQACHQYGSEKQALEVL